jgi:GxxExxY protein
MEEAESMRISDGRRENVHDFVPLSRQVIGAAIEVQRKLGPGFREDVYHKSLLIELTKRSIPFLTPVTIPVFYDGVQVGYHELDLLVSGSPVVELRAVPALAEIHFQQTLAYCRAANVEVGLVLNFGQLPLGIRRVVNSYRC